MADNTQVTTGTGDSIRDKDRAGVKTQIVGLDLGIGTGTEALMSGAMPTKVTSLTLTTGTITGSAQSVTATTDIPNAGSVTVVVGGTYAGVNVAFEASVDGTTWIGLIGQRTDSYVTEIVSGVLTANQIRAWDFPLPGFTQFRVRSTAYTSGTMAVAIAPAVNPFEIAPTAGDATAGTATLTQPSISASSFTVLAANPARRAAYVYNDSSQVVYIAFASTASTTAYTAQIQPQQLYELPNPCYNGLLTAIASTATGSLRVTEVV